MATQSRLRLRQFNGRVARRGAAGEHGLNVNVNGSGSRSGSSSAFCVFPFYTFRAALCVCVLAPVCECVCVWESKILHIRVLSCEVLDCLRLRLHPRFRLPLVLRLTWSWFGSRSASAAAAVGSAAAPHWARLSDIVSMCVCVCLYWRFGRVRSFVYMFHLSIFCVPLTTHESPLTTLTCLTVLLVITKTVAFSAEANQVLATVQFPKS